MSRSLRIEYEGAWYHVMNRGRAKQRIFHKRVDLELFLKLLGEIHALYQVKIHAYCLMGNHYHLLLETPFGNLSRAMRHLDGVYTQKYNYFHKKDGSLFRGRFKSVLIDSDNYLIQLTRYIHLNPVVDGLVEKAENYLWSSYKKYLNSESLFSESDWLTTLEVLRRFNGKSENYRIFVEKGIDKEVQDFFDRSTKLPILGDKQFVEKITQKYIENRPISAEIVEHKRLKQQPTIKRVLKQVADFYGVDLKLLKTIYRKRGNKPRIIAIYLARELTGQDLRTIADEFLLCYSSISKVFKNIKRALTIDRQLADEVKILKEKILEDKNLTI
jgi:putative transposase